MSMGNAVAAAFTGWNEENLPAVENATPSELGAMQAEYLGDLLADTTARALRTVENELRATFEYWASFGVGDRIPRDSEVRRLMKIITRELSVPSGTVQNPASEETAR